MPKGEAGLCVSSQAASDVSPCPHFTHGSWHNRVQVRVKRLFGEFPRCRHNRPSLLILGIDVLFGDLHIVLQGQISDKPRVLDGVDEAFTKPSLHESCKSSTFR